ncbi:MAG TPA: leucyl aminopeptidase [Alphaproteobacteria bacterium]|nr:leucyl aminopeptidase [Alphaproteobacteria bacterium]
MKISFAEPAAPTGGTIVALVMADRTLSPGARALDERSGGMIGRALAASRFSGKRDETLAILAPSGIEAARILLAGIGAPEKFDALAAQSVGAAVAAQLAAAGEAVGTVVVDAVEGATVSAPQAAAAMAFGARLKTYRFDRYRTKEKAEDKPRLESLVFQLPAPKEAKKAYAALGAVADGVVFARDLVSEPPNVLYPESLAQRCRELEALGVEVEVLDEKQMRKRGMNALLAVGMGSERDSQLVVMRWNGAADKGAAPLALVGKGITFDTGGISIKPAAGMEEMKWDMGGSAAVIGAMRAIAGRKARANVVGVVALAENMPSGNAQRPGDVVVSMSGQTIEVINTDAEGRLVLADALTYVQQEFKPRAIVDLATLTGAMIMALGHEYAGVFSNDDALAEGLVAAGKAAGEPLWRMPLGDAYDRGIRSDIADMKNIAGPAVGAGSIIGAVFLQRFVNNVPWAHIDIAGVAWSASDQPLSPKGATAFGVRLLDRLVADRFEA